MNLDFDPFMRFEQLEHWTEALRGEAPHLVRTGEIGISPEGRRLILLTITDFSTGEPETKPGFAITANMHCHELAGPLAALNTAKALVEDHRPGGILSHTVFYILPRVNPDSTERVIGHSGYIRSRCDYSTRPNTFRQQDIDGDGRILQMRIETPDGDMCRNPDHPDCMIPRTADSAGPFYRVCAEGLIRNYDGESRNFIWEGAMRDWNRNWPCRWTPETAVAGDFPLCEPEAWNLGKFLGDRKNLFMHVDYHNGWGSIFRPSEQDMDKGDRKLYRLLARMGEQCIGYPSENLRFAGETADLGDHGGMLVDHVYYNLGLLSWTVELGTFEHSAGLSTEAILRHDSESDYQPWPELFRYQERHPEVRPAIHPWKKFLHPQLGPVEIGGIDIPALAVPVPAELPEICRKTHAFTLKLAGKQPHLQCLDREVRELAPGFFRARIRLCNVGELSTSVTRRALKLPRCAKPFVELETAEAIRCVSYQRHFELEHFAPWESRTLEWFFAGTPAAGKLAVLHLTGGAAGSFDIPLTMEQSC